MELEDESSALKFLNELSECRTSPTGEDFVHLRTGIIGNYNLKPEEVERETLDWALQFLDQRKCPSTLALSMAKYVSQQMSDLETQKTKSNKIEQTGYPSSSLEAVSLHTQTLHNLHDLCDYWRDHPDQMNTNMAQIRQPSYYTSICTIKNGRRKMEDRYTVLHDLNTVCGLQNVPHFSYYGVFDGHAGIRAANYAASHLHNNIAQHPAFPTDPVTAIKEGFQLTDNQILEKSKHENTKSGCTVVCSFIQENSLYIAWVGDSQAILVREGVPYIVTNPHKPDRQDERQRIEDLNGCVLYVGTWRVNGTLAVSRALGDPEHKPYVSAVPDIVTIPLQGNEDFVVLACDGLWDRLTPSDVASAIYCHLVENQPSDYEDLASRLVQQAKEHGSSDNITAIIVFLKSPQELAANPKNPPSYSLQLDGSKVDNWYQGSWNGISENGNNIFIPPGTMFSESTVKPDSLEIMSTAENVNNIKKFYFDSSGNENNDNYGNGFKDSCQSSIKPMLPEATVFSELPTPPIDELLASQQFGAQNEVIASLPYVPFDDMSLDSKSSNSTTLADSGILDPENTQTKPSESGNLQNNLMLNLGDVKDDSTSNSNVEVDSEIVNSAVEIVNNAIELAVNQVKVRASSQSSQHPDDSGLEEGPLEESDVSPESTSPEVDKCTRSLQDAASVNRKVDEINVKSGELLQSNTDFQNLAQIIQEPKVLLMELSSEQVVSSEMNLDPFESCQFHKHLQDDEQSNIKQITKDQTKENNEIIDITNPNPMLPGKKLEEVELPDATNLLCFDSVPLMPTIIDVKSVENKIENVESTKETDIYFKETQSNIVSHHTDLLEQGSVVETTQHTDLLKPVSVHTVLCTATCPTESSQSLPLPSPFPSEVGQLLEQFTDKEKKPAALSDSLSEDLQVNNAAIDLVAIPDGVPEAEGVTEDADSDSEKDGGWSYIQGGKSDLTKSSTPKSSVNNTMKSSNKKSTTITSTTGSKPLKKEPGKTTTDVKSIQQKPSSMVKKKIIPEKIGKEKLPPTSSNVTARKTPSTSRMAKTTADQIKKPISVINDQTKKPVTTVSDQNKKPPSTLASKTLREMNKSQPKENSISRPKSASLTPHTKIIPPKSNVATVQKTTARTLSKTQTKTTPVNTTTVTTTTTASLVQKTVQKPLTTTMQRTGTKTVSTVSATRSVVQTSKTSLTRPSVKQIEIKQTKDSTNKQISSKPPPAIPKDAMQRNNFSTQVRKSNSVQSSLSTRTTVAQKSAHSKQPAPSVHRLTPTTRPPSSRTKQVEQSAAKLKSSKEKLKSNEKPKESFSEQEKGTLEAVAKENMSNAVSLENETENIPKISDKPIISGDSDIDHLSVEKETEIKLESSICQNEVAVNVEKIETQE